MAYIYSLSIVWGSKKYTLVAFLSKNDITETSLLTASPQKVGRIDDRGKFVFDPTYYALVAKTLRYAYLQKDVSDHLDFSILENSDVIPERILIERVVVGEGRFHGQTILDTVVNK